jgi:hypothetical protein
MRQVAPCLAAGHLVAASFSPVHAEPVPMTAELKECVPESWTHALWPDPKAVRFRETTLEESAAFSLIVPALLRAAETEGAAPPAHLHAIAELVGFRIEVWEHRGEMFWALLEREDRRRGAGAYVFRTGRATDDFIQAPHAYFDEGTGALGAGLFCCAPSGMRPRMFATNTAHRYRGRPGETRDDDEHPADVAHNGDHLFQRVTDLVAQQLPTVRVLQLHGFAPKETTARAALTAVVSEGSRTPSKHTRAVAKRLEALLGQGVRLFPDQTEVLGATTNVQGQLLQQLHPRARFIHLELSAPARRALTHHEQLARLTTALLHPLEDEP